MIEGATSFTRTGRSTLPPFPDLLDDDRRMYYGTFQFPNLLLNLHPDAAMAYTLLPARPGPHHGRVRVPVPPGDDRRAGLRARSPVVELWDLISRQDWEICERAQTGVGSRGYARGGVYPRKDRFLFDFNERWRSEMGRPSVG